MHFTLQTYVCYFHHELCECLHRTEPNFAVGYTFHRNGSFFIVKSQRQEGVSSEQLTCMVYTGLYIFPGLQCW